MPCCTNLIRNLGKTNKGLRTVKIGLYSACSIPSQSWSIVQNYQSKFFEHQTSVVKSGTYRRQRLHHEDRCSCQSVAFIQCHQEVGEMLFFLIFDNFSNRITFTCRKTLQTTKLFPQSFPFVEEGWDWHRTFCEWIQLFLHRIELSFALLSVPPLELVPSPFRSRWHYFWSSCSGC